MEGQGVIAVHPSAVRKCANGVEKPLWHPYEDIVTFGFFGLPGFDTDDGYIDGSVRLVAFYTLYRDFKKGSDDEPYGFPALAIYDYDHENHEFKMIERRDPIRRERPLGYWVFDSHTQWHKFTNQIPTIKDYSTHPWYPFLSRIGGSLRSTRKSIWREDGALILSPGKGCLIEEMYSPAVDSQMLIRGFLESVPRRLFTHLGSAKFAYFKSFMQQSVTMFTDTLTFLNPRIEDSAKCKQFLGGSPTCPADKVFV